MQFPSRASSRAMSLVVLALSAALSSLPAFAVEVHRFDIPEESASAAIRDFGSQAHVQVLVAGENVKNKKLHAVSGNLSTEDALNKMLEGSGLTHKYVGDGSIAIIPLNLTTAEPESSGSAQPGEPGKGGRESQGPFLLAQAAQGQTGGALPVESSKTDKSESQYVVQEVVVTAQKTQQNSLDVPMSVAAVSAESLTDQGEFRFQDYFSNFPGLTFSSGNRGEIFPVIRGLNTGVYTTTVGITVDDIPYGPTGGLSAPDIDPSELERIEVLEGPQGTLYGSDSLGGLIKYVTVDPSTKELSGRLEAGTDAVKNGAELGFSGRGAINVPVTDTLALRLSGYTREDPGYIDNPVLNINGVNESHSEGGHLAALWSPSDAFSIKLGALIQHMHSEGSDQVFLNTPGFGDLQQNYLPGGGVYDKLNELYDVIVKAKLGSIDITSLSSYSHYRQEGSLDLSQAFAPFPVIPGTFNPVPNEAILLNETSVVNQYSQELRFASSFGSHVDWLFGAFYLHQNQAPNPPQYLYPIISTLTYQIVGSFGSYYTPSTFQEYAGFTNFTFHVTDRFDVQLGGRLSHDDSYATTATYAGDIAHYFFGQNPFVSQSLAAVNNPFTYSFVPSFKLTPDAMVYARLGSGFRPGGGNSPEAAILGLPPSFGPDKTETYELGVKGQTPNHRLTYTLAVYRTDWKDIQLEVTGAHGQGFVANAGGAKSQGIEGSVSMTPVDGLSISGWIEYNAATLTYAMPATSSLYGQVGDVLPYAPRFSSNLSAEDEFAIDGDWRGYVGARISYVGERLGNFESKRAPDRQVFPSYAETDLHAGVRYNTWDLRFYANNVADKRGITGGGLDNEIFDNAFTIIQPLTFGLTLSKKF